MESSNNSFGHKYTTNLANSTYVSYENNLKTYIVPVVFFIIFLVGILGNGTLIFIFFKHTHMRSIPNIYIFSLALSDFLIITAVVPFASIVYTRKSWPCGLIMCKCSEFLRNVSMGVSIFTLTALSAGRCSIVVMPLRRLQTKKVTVINVGIIWLLATLLAIPDVYCSRLQEISLEFNETLTICTPFPNIANKIMYQRLNVAFKALLFYIMPLCIITFFYILMTIRLHSNADDMPVEMKRAQSVEHAKSRRQVATMVLIFVFLFFICFLPHHVFMLWFHFTSNADVEYNEWWHAVRTSGFCMSIFHSCLNPVVLYCVSGSFRGYFNRYLCCRKSRCWKKQ